jgi:exonuclease SbcC
MAGINSLHERQASLETDLAATRADHRKVELLQDDAVNQAEVFQAVLNGLEPRRQAMPQRQALLNRRLAMREALSGLEELARQRDRLLAETAQREQALEERTAAGKAMAGRLESGRRDREAELSWALAGSTVESLLGLLDRLHELGNRLHQRSGQEERLAQQVQRQTDELASLVREEAGLRTELADAEVRERLDRAATLAATLSEGHPCPVCGSPHHPAPARKAGGEHDPDHRDQWHRRVEELAGLRQAMGIQHGVDQSHLERLGGEIRECRQSMLALRQEILDSIASRDNGGTSLPPDIAACLAAARALAAAPFPERSEWPELARLRESAGQLVRRCQAAGRSVSQLDKQLEALEKGLAEQDQARQSARDESAAWRERLGACENRLAEEGRRLAGEFGQNGQEPPRREQLELQISGDQAWLERSALEWQQAEASLAEQRGRQAVAAGRLADLDARLSSLQDMADQAKAAWQDAFRAAGFADASQALSRLMPAARLAALESGLAAYKQDLALARNRRAELEAALAGRTEADLARLERECQEQENALAEAEAGCARLEHALGHATAQAAELRALRGAQGQRQASLDSLGALFRLVSGQEAAGGYVNLPRYALSVYLDEILLVANQYLREMTRGRYELVREDQTVGKKRTGGLELYVSDTVTGVRRGTESLSGGESFMTALSLALGLSSVVHARSGGVRLDTLFVDEGFGSLDEDSLEDAMRVLGRIHERGRVIGIISHVRELQERIACRLVVDKGPAGSGAAWSR